MHAHKTKPSGNEIVRLTHYRQWCNSTKRLQCITYPAAYHPAILEYNHNRDNRTRSRPRAASISASHINNIEQYIPQAIVQRQKHTHLFTSLAKLQVILTAFVSMIDQSTKQQHAMDCYSERRSESRHK